ncbi:hypothetical protein ACIPY2_21460 [Paenarthrobacter sp. NPDC089675]|uniref:hypothetical protein n=1 Tax=Paenarthrobacter TaxID=1742992 RepID=UPI003817AD33
MSQKVFRAPGVPASAGTRLPVIILQLTVVVDFAVGRGREEYFAETKVELWAEPALKSEFTALNFLQN